MELYRDGPVCVHAYNVKLFAYLHPPLELL